MPYRRRLAHGGVRGSRALKQTYREDIILLYAPALGPRLHKMTELVDWMFCIYEGQAASARSWPKAGRRMPEASENAEGIFIDVRPRSIKPRLAVSTKVLEQCLDQRGPAGDGYRGDQDHSGLDQKSKKLVDGSGDLRLAALRLQFEALRRPWSRRTLHLGAIWLSWPTCR